MFKQLNKKKRKIAPEVNNYIEKSRHIAEHIKKRKMGVQEVTYDEYENNAEDPGQEEVAYEVVTDQYEIHHDPDIVHLEEVVAEDLEEQQYAEVYEDPVQQEVVLDYESEEVIDTDFDDRIRQEELNLQDITNKLELDAMKEDEVEQEYEVYEHPETSSNNEESVVEEYLEEDDLIVEDPIVEDNSKVRVMTLLKCPMCPSVFSNANSFEAHMTDDHVSKNCFICGLCKTRLSTEQKLREHIKVYHIEKGNVLQCELCHYKSHVKRNYDKHVQRHYRESGGSVGNKFYNCPKCPQSFRDSESKDNHIRYMHA